MRQVSDRPSGGWLMSALCRRYAAVHFSGLNITERVHGVVQRRPWCWAFAMFKPGEYQILGAWRLASATIERVVTGMSDRGALSIRVLSIDSADDSPNLGEPEALAAALRGAAPSVLTVVSADRVNAGMQIDGVSTMSMRAALNSAGRINRRLAIQTSRQASFSSADAAAEFIFVWLQRESHRLYAKERALRRATALPVRVASVRAGAGMP